MLSDRLLCFPYAGAGASMFHAWPRLLPPDVELISVQLPGREDRAFEAPFTEIGLLADTVALALRPYLSMPVVLFGHCAGGLLAYEVAAALAGPYGGQVDHLIVSAHPAPHEQPVAPVLHTLPDEELRAELGRMGAAAREVLDDDDLSAGCGGCRGGGQAPPPRGAQAGARPLTTTAAAVSGAARPPALVHGAAESPPEGWPPTLAHALHRAAVHHGGHGTTYVLADGSRRRQTYADLLSQAQRVLGGLRGMGLRPGSPVLLQLRDNRNFVTALWACVLGGFVPTPVAVAPTYREHNATTRRLHNAWLLLNRPLQLEPADVLVAVVPDDPATDPEVLARAVRTALSGPGRTRVAAVAALPRHPDSRRLATLNALATGRPAQAEPEGAVERAIAGLWRQAQSVSAIGRDQHFFEAGGDSLTALHLTRLLDERFGIGPAVHLLYENPTIRQLAAALRRHHTEHTP
ncbi:thioesterase domain-containing protein [Nonomuraea typhae]|uniref:Thioesterase domain-containing protein n=1 Tax=Nonomuraea typhae TaxID=2603600 RepID=A0ABW7ZAT1_9ACTN